MTEDLIVNIIENDDFYCLIIYTRADKYDNKTIDEISEGIYKSYEEQYLK